MREYTVQGIIRRNNPDDLIPWDDSKVMLSYHDHLNGLVDGTYYGEWDVFI